MRSALLYNVSNLILVPWELAAAVSSASLTRRRETYETILVDVLWCSISSIFQRCSGCEISEKKNDLWAQNLIHIRIPLCWYSEEIGVPFQTFILHARSPGISSILHKIFSGLLVSCWVRRWIQEDFSSDESSDEGTPRKDLPSVTLRGGCTRHRELGHVIRPWWWVVAGPGWFMI